jgi:hypothetical protein
MSSATVLTLPSAEHNCPVWCAQDPHAEATGSHVSAPVRLTAPKERARGSKYRCCPCRSASVTTRRHGANRPACGSRPSTAPPKLDSAALGSFIDGLERFALSLRGLRHRYDTVIRGGATEAIDHYPSATHPLELVAPCPPWCQYRDDDEHTPDGLLVDHFHAAHVHAMELTLQPVTRTKAGPEPETLELGLAHMGTLGSLRSTSPSAASELEVRRAHLRGGGRTARKAQRVHRGGA